MGEFHFLAFLAHHTSQYWVYRQGALRQGMLSRISNWRPGADLTSSAGRALVEENYWSVRRQTPIIYLLGLVNLSAMEMAATGKLSMGANVPTFIAGCGIVRMAQWYSSSRSAPPSHELMAKRLQQTVWFAAAICIAVCARCLYLFQVGDAASHMAVMLFAGLTAIGVAYGLTALPVAGWIPLVLIIGPVSAAGFLAHDRRFAGAAFGLVVVAALTSRLLGAHSHHFTTVVRSRSLIAREQELVEHARQEALIAATTDFLTGLPNRRALVAALDTVASEASGSFALAILDLNNFKAVNDMFGHGIGDQLLNEVAERLTAAVGNSGLVARLGGDEFGVLLPHVQFAEEARAIGEQILHGVDGSTFLDDREFVISASCGIGLSREADTMSPSRIMADADLALYQAKENPGSSLAIFEPIMEAPRRRRAQIERALQLPGVYEHLGVVFQPIFDLKSGRIIAHEALARWCDPELGAIAPSEFVPIAEQLNVINEINAHLMQLAFEAAHGWAEEIRLSFNLSAVQLRSAGAARLVLDGLASAGLPPTRLQVEVTETALLADFARARANLTELKKEGTTIILDDFGAGFASIGYLRELHFDQIKLDGGLVTAAHHSADGKRLLRAVIGLCEVLGVSTVAEHVESKEILELVVELGCTAGQGFWLEPPRSAADVAGLSSARVVSMRPVSRRA
jgi:diguanylate cyclase (GGDEF)-like protein